MSKKKRPPVAGRRSNYAHLTDINLQALCHRNVKRVHSVFTGGSADSSLIPQATRKIHTSAGHNGLPSSGTMCKHSVQLIRVSKHSIVSHRSPAIESGIFLCLEVSTRSSSSSWVGAALWFCRSGRNFAWSCPLGDSETERTRSEA